MHSLQIVRGRLVLSVVASAALIVWTSNRGECEPPTVTQWQRDVEAERIYEEWRKGNFDTALKIARDLVRDYKKAVQESERKRSSIRTPTISYREALPHILQKNFVLGQTARMVGDYETARRTFEELDEDLTRLEADLTRERGTALAARSLSLNNFLLAASGPGLPPGQVNYSWLFSSYHNVVVSTLISKDKNQQLAGAVYLHGQLFDEYGTLEIDAGKYKHAAWLFGKSENYYSYLNVTDDIAIFRKHLRNHARLLVKQAEADLSEGRIAACEQELDRAASYLVRIERHLDSSARDVPGRGLSEPKAAPDAPADWEDPGADWEDPGADWEAADLYFNLAEYCCARADLIKAKSHPDAMLFLDNAEAHVARATDQLISLTALRPDDHNALLPNRESGQLGHPFLGYCWLEYAGLNARRVLYCPAGTPKATKTSYAEDMKEYWRRGQQIARAAVNRRGNLFHDILEKEEDFVVKAEKVAKAIDQQPDEEEEVSRCSVPDPAGSFPDPGSRVKRGPDWDVLCHAADGGGDDAEGTVVRIDDYGWLIVCWDKTGRETAHRRRGDGREDVSALDGALDGPAAKMHPEGSWNPLQGEPPPGAVVPPPAGGAVAPNPGNALNPGAARGSRRLRP